MTDQRSATYQAYLDAWVDVANQPGVSERSVPQAAAAAEAEHRLEAATQAHYDACLAAEPERELEDPEAEIG